MTPKAAEVAAAETLQSGRDAGAAWVTIRLPHLEIHKSVIPVHETGAVLERLDELKRSIGGHAQSTDDDVHV